MYKTKDEEGRKRERKRRSWGSRRSSYRQGIRQRRSKQATVQMELPGKVRDLCQICNWARTVTTRLKAPRMSNLVNHLAPWIQSWISDINGSG